MDYLTALADLRSARHNVEAFSESCASKILQLEEADMVARQLCEELAELDNRYAVASKVLEAAEAAFLKASTEESNDLSKL